MARLWGRAARIPETAPRRPSRHDRHGRVGRSSVVRPPLPPLDTRFDRFEIAVGGAAEFLRSAWPELIDVRYEIAAMPEHPDPNGLPRWWTSTAQKRIDVQKDFVSNLVDSLRSGIGSMVDANMEEASARLQALQVQQQLGVQSLSIANQAPQNILSLFR